MRKLVMDGEAFEDYKCWIKDNPRIALKISDLITEILKTPFEGKGKPEALKHELKGFWSRRINDEHRLIYQVNNDEIIIVRCKTHYR